MAVPERGAWPMTEHQSPWHAFVLAGQSNMAGRGGVHGLPGGGKEWDQEQPCEGSPDLEIRCWDASGQWRHAEEPMHADIDMGKVCGVGPGLVFAETLHKIGCCGSRIGLVPCAIGGSCIDEWLPGTPNFERMVQRAQAAMAALPAKARLEGLVWYQGESDADSPEKVQSYFKKQCTVFHTFRSRLTDYSSLAVPIVQVAITCTNTEKAPYWHAINQLQLTKITEYLPYLATVDANGLALQADGLHLTTKAQCWLGRALAEEFKVIHNEELVDT